MTAPHTLIVTGEFSADEGDFREYQINCPGVSPGCVVWVDCRADNCNAAALAAEASGGDREKWVHSVTAHGVEHNHNEEFDTWDIPGSQCWFVHHADGLDEEAERLAIPGDQANLWGLVAGQYEVIPVYDGDGAFHLELPAVSTAHVHGGPVTT